MGKFFTLIIDFFRKKILGLKQEKKSVNNYKRSEAEDVIAEFFDEETIDFNEQVPIKLDNDTKAYRVADFYLPEYDTYVEFLGKWNDTNCREEYKIKMQQYKKNNVKCIYFFPDNLGALNFLFKRRLRKSLRNNKQNFKLFLFNSEEYRKKNGLMVFILIGLLYYLRKDPLIWLFGLGFLMFLYISIKKEFFS